MEEKEEVQQKKPNIIFRLFAVLVSAALVLGTLALILNRDTINLDALVRWFTYHSLQRSDSGEAEAFSYEGASDSLFASIGDDLLTISEIGIHLYSRSGTEYSSNTTAMEHPMFSSSEQAAVVYDAGGKSLFVYRDREEVFSLPDFDGTILSASLNQKGWLTVVTHEEGYKAVITVYDSDFDKSVGFRISSAFVTDAVLSDDCNTLAVVMIGDDDISFDSTVNYYHLNEITDSADELSPNASCSLGDNIVLDMKWLDDRLWALGESGLTVISEDATVLGTTDWSTRFLKSYAISSGGFCAVLTGLYQSGTDAALTVYMYDGTVLGEMDVTTQILSLSAAGRYLSVLTSDQLTTYIADLSLYDELDGTQGATEVLQRSDGSAFLASSTEAWLYVPN